MLTEIGLARRMPIDECLHQDIGIENIVTHRHIGVARLPGISLGWAGFSWNACTRPSPSAAITPKLDACPTGTGSAEIVTSA